LELENYEENVSKDTQHILKDLATNSPCGRMIIFDGPPGCGKTYLVRGLLSEIKNAMFVLIPPDLAGELTNPNLVKTIVSNHDTLGGPTVFIIEDADKCLASRGPDNLHILSNILNLSDGIVGSLCDIRVICTTNARSEDIEEAILRPGRLCRRIHIGELTKARGMAIFKRLTGKDLDLSGRRDSTISLAEVYRLARQDGWEPKKVDMTKIVGFRHNDGFEWD
jgi:SpoVK/Ycf46/Vps4 family AAA+-type ATPase